MKKVICIVSVLLCAALLFVGCSGTPAASASQLAQASTAPSAAASISAPAASASAAAPASAAGKPISIALLDSSNGNAWRAQMEQEMNQLVTDYKSKGLISNYVAYSANDDATVQAQQLNQIVSAGKTDVVLINPASSTALNPAIDKAVAAGIKVIGLDSIIQDANAVTISTDQSQWASAEAQFLADKLGGKGKIVIFEGIQGVPASDMRQKAYHDVLAKYPGIQILKEVYHGWDEGKAKQTMATLISAYPEIDGVLNQECSPGIMQAYQEAGVAMPKVLGSDETVNYLNLWDAYNTKNPDKAFEGIIVGNPPGVGADAIKLAVQLMNGKTFKASALTDVSGGKALLLKPSPIITNENRAEFVAKTKGMADTYTFSTVLSDDEIAAFFN
jgi:ribose transport system substrate-binding protein